MLPFALASVGHTQQKRNTEKERRIFLHILLRGPSRSEFPHSCNRWIGGADGHDAVPRPLYKVSAPCFQNIKLLQLIKF